MKERFRHSLKKEALAEKLINSNLVVLLEHSGFDMSDDDSRDKYWANKIGIEPSTFNFWGWIYSNYIHLSSSVLQDAKKYNYSDEDIEFLQDSVSEALGQATGDYLEDDFDHWGNSKVEQEPVSLLADNTGWDESTIWEDIKNKWPELYDEDSEEYKRKNISADELVKWVIDTYKQYNVEFPFDPNTLEEVISRNITSDGTASDTLKEWYSSGYESYNDDIDELEQLINAMGVADYRHNSTEYDNFSKSGLRDEDVSQFRKNFNSGNTLK